MAGLIAQDGSRTIGLLRLSVAKGLFSGSQHVDLSDYWPKISRRRGPRLRKLPWDLEEASDLNFLRSAGAFEMSQEVGGSHSKEFRDVCMSACLGIFVHLPFL